MDKSTWLTERADPPDGRWWHYRKQALPLFDQRYFNIDWLRQQNHVIAAAAAGRGNTWFLSIDGYSLVLRQYRRGGLARRLSSDAYWWLGLSRTRAYKELHILQLLESWKLPAPIPFACEVLRVGNLYTASLITYCLPGDTLAVLLESNELTETDWQKLGKSIASFHQRGVYHADLNAHNIVIDAERGVALLDFDRARIKSPARSRWRHANLTRLHRSVEKVVAEGRIQWPAAGWLALQRSYQMAMDA